MSRNTQWVRNAWTPACKANLVSTKDAYTALDRCFRRWNYRPKSGQTWGYNCLAGETAVLTWDGVIPISDLAGQTVRLLTAPLEGHSSAWCKWVDAEVHSFGEQEIAEIHLSRHGVRKVIRATLDHRWIIRRDPKRTFRETKDSWASRVEMLTSGLTPGDRLVSAYPISAASRMTPSSIGVAHGFVFGDGTLGKHGASVSIFAASKDEEMVRFFPEPALRIYHDETHGTYQRISGLPRYFKQLPSLDEAPNYLYGFLAGYFAADGSIADSPRLWSVDLDALLFVRDLCTRLGIATFTPTVQKRNTSIGGRDYESHEIWCLGFGAKTLDSGFFIRLDQREAFNGLPRKKGPPTWVVDSVERTGEIEPVFCAVVPETATFALAENILTGNCRRITGGSGYSLHAFDPGERFVFWTGVTVTMAVATDVNSLSNPYGRRLVTDMPKPMIDAILAIRTIGGLQVWRWGGYYSNNKDAMHFELIVSPAELARGINWLTVPSLQEEASLMVTPEDEKKIREIVKDELKNAEALRIGVIMDGKKDKLGIDHFIKALAIREGVMLEDGTWVGA